MAVKLQARSLRLALLTSALATLASVVACSTSTPGEPSADGSGPSTTTPAGSSTSSALGAGLPVNQPCSLLSAAALDQIGVSSPPSEDQVGTAHSCELDSSAYHIGLDIRTDVGLAGFQGVSGGGHLSSHTIGRHMAKEQPDNGSSSCTVAVGVSQSSRVDVTATGDGTTDPCPTAMAVAELVEPKLP